jgi:hypothetical protein
MAKGAQIPIALAFFDFPNKTGGIGQMLEVSDNMDADMQIIANFYLPKAGKNPANYNPDITGQNIEAETDVKF